MDDSTKKETRDINFTCENHQQCLTRCESFFESVKLSKNINVNPASYKTLASITTHTYTSAAKMLLKLFDRSDKLDNNTNCECVITYELKLHQIRS
jgi:hypothetical protein